jgi:adenylate cyclase
MNYTAMGDAVNLASRLEGLNKYYATSAMISGTTYEGVKDHVDTRRLDIVRVVGKSEAVPIYELLGPKGGIPDRIYEMLAVYNQGRDHFLNRDWKLARNFFKQALRIVPDDGPSMVFVKRCEEFMKNPPPRNWDGVYVLKGK